MLIMKRTKKKLKADNIADTVIYTDRDTKLLYWVMLRFKISAHGPKTRSNLALSSFTHFKGPRATTVAALGLSNNNAISPKINKKLLLA